MRRVIVESPFRGVPEAVLYARLALADCLQRDEAPLASHLLYTQVLDDGNPDQRRLGIEAGLAWGVVADATIVYTDFGISEGMQLGIARAESEGRPVEYRQLGGPWNSACPRCDWLSQPEGHYTKVAALRALDAHTVTAHPELLERETRAGS